MKGWSPFHQDEKKMKVTPGEKAKPKYRLKVGTKPDGTKDYFKVDEKGTLPKPDTKQKLEQYKEAYFEEKLV